LTECAMRDGIVAVRLVGRAPSGGQLMAATLDGTFGIDLLTESGAPAAPAGSTLGTTPEDDAEFDLAYQAPRGAPSRLRIRAVVRSGARHALPFRIEHIPLPARPERETR